MAKTKQNNVKAKEKKDLEKSSKLSMQIVMHNILGVIGERIHIKKSDGKEIIGIFYTFDKKE